MLEKMDAFFEKRIKNYDSHMLNNIEGADEFYKFTASLLPKTKESKVLDLGCGTGLELEEYFKCNPSAKVTAIDLSKGMLDIAKRKFQGKNIEFVLGSYFDIPFGHNIYDAVVSVESLHHFTQSQKTYLYKKIYDSLKPSSHFILTDYFAESYKLEKEYFKKFEELKQTQNIHDNSFYHYDTPLTLEHEIDILKNVNFQYVDIMNNWNSTYTIKAIK